MRNYAASTASGHGAARWAVLGGAGVVAAGLSLSEVTRTEGVLDDAKETFNGFFSKFSDPSR